MVLGGTDRRGDIIAVAVIVVALTTFFFDILFLGSSLFYRDIATYHYPSKRVIRDIVARGDFPLWNPVHAGGQPAAANPEYEVFYPGQWPIFLPSFDFGFRLHIILHYYLAALGTYALMRSLGARAAASCATALGFALGGPMASSSNILPGLFSMAWLPLILLFARRFLRQGRRRDFAIGALLLAMQELIFDPAVIVATWALVGGYAIYRWLIGRDSPRLGRAAALIVAGVLAGAVQVLPLIDHAHDSTRSRPLPFAMTSLWSLPLGRVAELINPHTVSVYVHGEGGPLVQSIYLGYVTLLAVITGLALRDRRVVVATLVAAGAWLVALGDSTPLLKFAFDHHLLPSLRFPERFVMTSALLLALSGGLILDRIIHESRARRMALVVAVGLCLAAATALPMLARAGALLLILAVGSRLPESAWSMVLVAFVLADLAPFFFELTLRIEGRYFTEPPRVLQELSPDRDQYRVFHQAEWHETSPTAMLYFTGPAKWWNLRNGLIPRITSQWGIRTVLQRDSDLTNLLPTVDLIDAMWEVQRKRGDWAEMFMAMSNVRYRTAYRPYAEELGRHTDYRDLQPIVFVPVGDNPRFYFADELVRSVTKDDFVRNLVTGSHSRRVAFADIAPFPPGAGRLLRVAERTNDATIDVDASTRSFLVIANTWHKYWQARLDGVLVPIVRTNLAYQGVVVPAGRHSVELRYRNPLIVIGGIISAITALILLIASTGLRGGSLPADCPARS
jgi:hypothetical protein